jgi:hypothetical protein
MHRHHFAMISRRASEGPPGYAFSSFFNSLMKRQSAR